MQSQQENPWERLNTKVSTPSSYSQSYQSQLDSISLVPVSKLFPANQILPKNIKSGNEQAKVIIKNKYEMSKIEKQLSDNLVKKNNLKAKMCFKQQDTLGYEYQNKFEQFLVYSRIMGTVSQNQWQNFISYNDQCKQNKNMRKYFSGQFMNQSKINERKQIIQNQQCVQKPQLIKNNLYLLTDLQQKNYMPNLIRFSANYPSANLMYAFKTDINEFQLILHNDSNSKGSTQWFNFTVTLPAKHTFQSIKFKIVNLTKSSSIFSKGMKVLYKLNKNRNWKRLNAQVEYTTNDISIQDRKNKCQYNILSFVYQNAKMKRNIIQNIQNPSQTISFAYGYPYTIQQNNKFWLQTINLNKKNKSKFTINKLTIGKSSSGLPIDIYKISDQQKQKSSSVTNCTSSQWISNKSIQSQYNKNNSKSIIFLARQHPGQTQSSYILQGIVQNILNTQQQTQGNSKKNYVFYFIPIVNIQGVLLGNYRANIKGYDLNRNWRNPVNQAQPQIVAIKKYLQKINKQNQISLIIDLHGHSKAFNSFFYGVNGNNNYNKVKCKQNSKIFPYFCSKKMKQISFQQCCFNVSQDKKNTARVVLSQIFPKALVYTLQSSFYGYKIIQKQNKEQKVIQYSPNQLRKLGSDLISTYFQYTQIDSYSKNNKQSVSPQNQNYLQNNKNKIIRLNSQIIEKQIQQFEKNIKNTKKLQNQDSQKQGDQSDSEAEQDLLDIVNTQQIIIKQQQQQQKNKKSIIQHTRKQRKLVTLANQIQRKKGNTFGMKGQMLGGTYLKTIQMIDTSRQQLNDEYFLHKFEREKQNILKSKNKIMIRRRSQKTQQKQNTPTMTPHLFTNIDLKKKVPLLSVNVIKPIKMLPPFSMSPASLSQNKKRLKSTQGFRFVNQKQLIFQQLRMRQKNKVINQVELNNNIMSIVRSTLNNIKMIEKQKQRERERERESTQADDYNEVQEKEKDKYKKMNIRFC